MNKTMEDQARSMASQAQAVLAQMFQHQARANCSNYNDGIGVTAPRNILHRQNYAHRGDLGH
jgi:hypothetical protein